MCRQILDKHDPKEIWIIDNLLSSEYRMYLRILKLTLFLALLQMIEYWQNYPMILELVFHLACYHGNQSSIADPIADHDNNTITSLKLFDHLKESKNLKKIVYAAAGCAVAEKTFEDPTATSEDAPVSLFHDSPYSISKLVGEMYGNYYGLVMDYHLLKPVFKMFMVREKFLVLAGGGVHITLFGEM